MVVILRCITTMTNGRRGINSDVTARLRGATIAPTFTSFWTARHRLPLLFCAPSFRFHSSRRTRPRVLYSLIFVLFLQTFVVVLVLSILINISPRDLLSTTCAFLFIWYSLEKNYFYTHTHTHTHTHTRLIRELIGIRTNSIQILTTFFKTVFTTLLETKCLRAYVAFGNIVISCNKIMFDTCVNMK